MTTGAMTLVPEPRLLAVTSPGAEIAAALWHNVVESTVRISQLSDRNKTSDDQLNSHPSVTVLTSESGGRINYYSGAPWSQRV